MSRTAEAGRYVYIAGGIVQNITGFRPVLIWKQPWGIEDELSRTIGWKTMFVEAERGDWPPLIPLRPFKFFDADGMVVCMGCNDDFWVRNFEAHGIDWDNGWGRPVPWVYRIDKFKSNITFERVRDLSTPRYYHASASYHGRCVVSGGKRGRNGTWYKTLLSTVEWHHPALNEWTPLGQLCGARGMHSMVVLDAQLYCIGGMDEKEYLVKWMERYDPSKNEWRDEVAPNVHRANMACCALNGKIYAAGGMEDRHPSRDKVRIPRYEDLGITNIMEVFDPVEKEWDYAASMHYARSGAQSCVFKGEFWVAGGRGAEGAKLRTVESYNPKTDTWTLRGNLLTEMTAFSMAVVTTDKGESLCTFGGLDYEDLFRYATNAIFRYDLEKEEWELLPEVVCPNSVFGVSTAVV